MSDFKRQLSSIFCDDVRYEVGQKLTFVGVYQGLMVVGQEYPFIIPKLCIVINAQAPIENQFKKLVFRTYKNDVVINEQEMIEPSSPGGPPEWLPEAKVRLYGAIITLQGIEIASETTLRIRAETESEELKAVGLKIVTHSYLEKLSANLPTSQG